MSRAHPAGAPATDEGADRPFARRSLVVLGDALLDRDVEGDVERLCPDAPVPVLDERRERARPGGAALAAALASADGHEVTLITALADDEPARELAGAVGEAGVELIDLGLSGPTPQKVRFRTRGRSLMRLDRGSRGGAVGAPSAAARAAIEWADAVLVSDYGRGLAAGAELREALRRVAGRAPLVWDPHPRGAPPVAGAALVTPNESEAIAFAGESPGGAAPVRCATALAERWRADAVCVTRGAAGAVLVAPPDAPRAVPARGVAGDPCGAGDRFAVSAALALAAGERAPGAVLAAVSAATEFVAAGGAAEALPGAGGGSFAGHEEVPLRAGAPGGAAAGEHPPDPLEVVAAVRARGGTVVATGGCFDLLHTGHVRTLAAARALGDCLVVCLNSDASVRRLKGARRPLVPEADRAAVLLALECVDAVTVFDEDTPAAALERLRPDVFAKGGDYTIGELPERSVLERWGGRAVLLPYLQGRSTTRLIEEVGSGAGS